MHTLTSRTRPVRGLLGIFALALLVLGGILPAHAHSELISTAPAADEQLAAAPDEIILTFNEDITDLGTEIVVNSPDGEVINDGALIIEGPRVRQPLLDARPAGAYQVIWRAVSADGHPISGEFVFTAASAIGIEEATPTPDGGATAEATTEPGTSGDTPAAQDPEPDGSGLSTTTWLVIAVVAAAAIALAIILARGLMSNPDDRGK